MNLTSDDDEVEHLVGSVPTNLDTGSNESSGVDTDFFLEVMASWGVN